MEQPSPEQIAKPLIILHAALLFSQLLFAAVAYFLVASGQVEPVMAGFQTFFYVLAAALALGGIVACFTFGNARLNALREIPDAAARINGYRSVSIIRWALLEGPSFLATTIFLLTGNLWFLILAGAVILLFILIRPTRRKIEELQS